MQIIKNEPLNKHTTMRVGGPAKYFCNVTNKQELVDCIKFAKAKNLPIETIGDGSNIIFTDKGLNGMVIKNQIKGFNLDSNGELIAYAGENWDNVVNICVQNNFAGIEALSYIPGTVGGAPVNNIGAYGQECKNTLKKVEVYNLQTEKFETLNNKQCQFSYRDSIFKSSNRQKYIIISVKFQLIKPNKSYHVPEYSSLKEQLQKDKVNNPTIKDVREAVIKLRTSKLPDPKKIPNTGSFFKNPIVKYEIYQKLLVDYPDMPAFNYSKNTKKLYAGWLIEKARLKNYSINGIGPYKNQALVIINPNQASYKDLIKVVNHIQKTIYNKFKIKLDVEPEIIQ